MRKLTYQEFEANAKKVHGDIYLYYHDYINNHTKVLITCLKCGITFRQIPANHSRGIGCPNCAILQNSKNRALTYQEFVTKAKKVHGEKFKYYFEIDGRKYKGKKIRKKILELKNSLSQITT